MKRSEGSTSEHNTLEVYDDETLWWLDCMHIPSARCVSCVWIDDECEILDRKFNSQLAGHKFMGFLSEA